MSFTPKKLKPPRRRRRGRWSLTDEAALATGVLVHNEAPHRPLSLAETCVECAVVRTAERRRMSVAELLESVPAEYGGRLERNERER